MKAARALAVLVTSVLLAACGAPLQNGGVEVLPGVGERLEAMCRYGGSAQQKICAAPPEEEEAR